MKKLFFCLICVLIFACKQHEKEQLVGNSGVAYTPPTQSKAALEADAVAESEPSNTTTPMLMDRMLIRAGELRFSTDDIEKTKAITKQLITHHGAIITNETYNNFENRIEYNYQIQVPQTKFDSLYNSLGKIADKVDVSNINTSDVTEEFVDVSARMKTKKSLEARYQQILNAAKNVKEMLEIERELYTVRADIESMQSRINFINKQVQYNTIQLVFYENQVGKISSNGFFNRLGNSFINSFRLIGDILVNLVYLWPFIILILIAFWWFKKRKA